MIEIELQSMGDKQAIIDSIQFALNYIKTERFDSEFDRNVLGSSGVIFHVRHYKEPIDGDDEGKTF